MSAVAPDYFEVIDADGKPRRFTYGEAKAEVIALAKKAENGERMFAHAFLAWGAMLAQLHDAMRDQRCWGKFIAESAIGNEKTVERAERAARACMVDGGVISFENAVTLLRKYNQGRASDEKPLREDRVTARALQIATGGRAPDKIVPVVGMAGTDVRSMFPTHGSESVAPPTTPASRPARAWYPGCDEDQAAAMVGVGAAVSGGGGGGGKNVGGTGTGGMAKVATPSVSSPSPTTAAPPTATDLPKGRRVDVLGQSSLMAMFAEAADLAVKFAERLRAGSVSEEVMRRFMDLARTA